MPTERQLESFRKYRDSVIWRLLRMENHIDQKKLTTYWKLIDIMMDLSLRSATALLKKRYGYQVKHLHRNTKQKGNPEKCYRLENRKRGEYQEVYANALLKQTIDLLQLEVKQLEQK